MENDERLIALCEQTTIALNSMHTCFDILRREVEMIEKHMNIQSSRQFDGLGFINAVMDELKLTMKSWKNMNENIS